MKDLVLKLFDKGDIIILSTEVRGFDLVVNFISFTSFWDANLENANFKNAKLWYTNFYSANLTNADLSGADLSNANLSGANLDGAYTNENTILKCIGHSICD